MLRLLREAVAEGEYASTSEALRDPVRAWHRQRLEDIERSRPCAPARSGRSLIRRRHSRRRKPTQGSRPCSPRPPPAMPHFERWYRPAALVDLDDIFRAGLRVSASKVVAPALCGAHPRARPPDPCSAACRAPARRSRARTSHRPVRAPRRDRLPDRRGGAGNHQHVPWRSGLCCAVSTWRDRPGYLIATRPCRLAAYRLPITAATPATRRPARRAATAAAGAARRPHPMPR